jgi:hypothetical protein
MIATLTTTGKAGKAAGHDSWCHAKLATGNILETLSQRVRPHQLGIALQMERVM